MRKVTMMGGFGAYGLLFVAALLEAGGDALIRIGLHNYHGAARCGLFVLGAIILFAYGVTVNAPAWDFGRLLGVYVTLFFLIAQVMNLVVFGVRPTLPVMIGGALIFAGGIVMTAWRP